MVYVVLRNGKMVQYNSGGAIAVEDGTITIRKDKSPDDWLIARIPMDMVERVEFSRPCAVVKTRIKKGGVDY